MIVSASYKTDIPAFYSDWFLNRLRAGYCKTVNPYNRAQHQTVSLRRQEVDGFVFWTKNLAPFLGVLDEVHQRSFPFVVQYTINGYPRWLESRVVDAGSSVRHFRAVADKHGPRVCVWRYDTIIISSETDETFHRQNFSRIAAQLAGATDEVVVSFMQLYDKTRRNISEAARTHGADWSDPPISVKTTLLRDLADIALKHQMRFSICSQPELVVAGTSEARCIDAPRLTDIAGRSFRASVKGMRKGCGCFESRDIGEYDTCPHGCVYCYAVRSRALALNRYKAHDPQSEYLFPPSSGSDAEQREGYPLFPEEKR